MSSVVEIRLGEGDVGVLGVLHERDRTRLIVRQRSEAEPLIQAILSEDERRALVLALRQRGCILLGP